MFAHRYMNAAVYVWRDTEPVLPVSKHEAAGGGDMLVSLLKGIGSVPFAASVPTIPLA